MIEACSQAGVTLTVCHDRRYSEEWGAIKEIIDSGCLGELFYFKLEHNQNVIFPENAWVRHRDGIGGGAIMSCLTHQIDALRWFGGEVDGVNCMSKVMSERMQGECIGVVLARMASGAIAQLSINWWTTSHRSQNGLWYELIHVCGKEGEAYYMTGKGTYLKIHDASDRSLFEYSLGQTDKGFEQVEVKDPRPGHERCITEWLKLVRGEEAHILTPGTDSRLTVEVAEAAYRAEECGQTVKLPIEPRPWVSFN
jgi:predicted dehydrogenase